MRDIAERAAINDPNRVGRLGRASSAVSCQ
jgi:hypothetical protein